MLAVPAIGRVQTYDVSAKKRESQVAPLAFLPVSRATSLGTRTWIMRNDQDL